MSKIGRKPIAISSAKIDINNGIINISSSTAKFTHNLPVELEATLKNNQLLITWKENTRENRVIWGLHRALLANKVKGVETGFTTVIKIVGLGFKAILSDKKIVFSLGYSHKIDYALPKDVSIEIDKTGQRLTLKSSDKFLLGNACDAIRSLRPPEPYKGTGIMLENEVIIRKAGKTKSS